MSEFVWYRLESDSYAEVLTESDGTIITEDPGIYAWRLSFSYPDGVLSSSQSMQQWIQRICRRPSLKCKNGKIAPTISVDLTIGGLDLTEEKRRTLRKLANNDTGRKVLAEYVSSLSLLSPILYVGMADNLSVRLRQHLSGLTDFAHQLDQTYPFGFENLTFQYCPVISTVPTDKLQPVLTLLEMILQRSVSPPGVVRHG